MAKFDIERWNDLLTHAAENDISDIHLAAGQPIFVRIQGKLHPFVEWIPNESNLEAVLYPMINDRQKQVFQDQHELDFAWSYGRQRFRINAFCQQHLLALAMRVIPAVVPSLTDLGMPAAMIRLLTASHGLILVTGRTGSGKSTTLAAFIDAINRQCSRHVITLEDPIEYVYTAGHCLINQREYNVDFFSFAAALRSTLREDPDIIVVGELRDAETIATALNAAETGHLVLASLHTQSAAETVLRLESFFPAEKQAQIRTQLAIVLAAIFSQQLLPAVDGRRVCAVETLTASAAVRNLIRMGKVQQIKSNIMAGSSLGMQTMEKSIADLAQQHKIAADVAQQYLK